MRAFNRDKLIKFSNRHAGAKGALDSWFSEAEQPEWKTPQDIKDRYRSADFLANNRVIFNILGNHYRLVVKMRYQNSIAVVEWMGTHAEDDKQRF